MRNLINGVRNKHFKETQVIKNGFDSLSEKSAFAKNIISSETEL